MGSGFAKVARQWIGSSEAGTVGKGSKWDKWSLKMWVQKAAAKPKGQEDRRRREGSSKVSRDESGESIQWRGSEYKARYSCG